MHFNGHRYKARSKWWYSMSDNRYPRKLLRQEWNVKPCRGGRRKSWRKTFCIVRLKSSWMK